MLQKIRCQMYLANESTLQGKVEADETYIGGKNKNRHWNKKVKHSQGRSHKDKTTVVGLIERGGLLSSLILDFVQKDSILFTDENSAYNQIGRIYDRYFVDHGKKQYGNGDITTNSIEGAWTHLKRMVIGTYRNLPKKHLQKYVDEFVFRYNLRDISNSDRFNCFLCCADTRYTYKQIKESVCLK